jgi:hypothetical protein
MLDGNATGYCNVVSGANCCLGFGVPTRPPAGFFLSGAAPPCPRFQLLAAQG